MYLIFKKTLLIILFIGIRGYSADLITVPADVPPGDHAHVLYASYNNIISNYKFNDFIGYEKAAQGFLQEIFKPVIPGTNEKYYLQAINTIYNQLPLLPSSSLVKLLQKQLITREKLARLDQAIFDNKANSGTINKLNLSTNIEKTINALCGRIFHIYQTRNIFTGVVDVNASGYGSAMLIAEQGGQPQKLQSNSNTALNAVLTCGHVLLLKQPLEDQVWTRTKVFFVRNVDLDLDTGLPKGLPTNTEQELIKFLTTNPNAYELETVYIKDSQKNKISNFKLEEAKPEFLENEDIAIVTLKFKGPQPTYNEQAIINFPLNITGGGGEFFSAGYPGCSHYTYTQGFITTPFFLSSSTIPPKSTNIAEKFQSYSTATHGMSGGPIFELKISPDEISILGVNLSVTPDGKYFGCSWS